MEKFKEFKTQKEKEIKALVSQIDSAMNELAGYIDQMYEEGGVEAFGKLEYPEYYGVASLCLDTPDGDGTMYYYFPDGMSEDYNGWIPSSQTC